MCRLRPEAWGQKAVLLSPRALMPLLNIVLIISVSLVTKFSFNGSKSKAVQNFL